MNVSSPTSAADDNEQPPQQSIDSQTPQCATTTSGILPSVQVTSTNRTDNELSTRIKTEKLQRQFASQAAKAALSLCSDSPEEEEDTPSSSHQSKLSSSNLSRQNRKCKSAIITVDGRSFTIGKIKICFLFIKLHKQKSRIVHFVSLICPYFHINY